MLEWGVNGHNQHNMQVTRKYAVTREHNMEPEDLSSATKAASSCPLPFIRQNA